MLRLIRIDLWQRFGRPEPLFLVGFWVLFELRASRNPLKPPNHITFHLCQASGRTSQVNNQQDRVWVPPGERDCFIVRFLLCESIGQATNLLKPINRKKIDAEFGKMGIVRKYEPGLSTFLFIGRKSSRLDWVEWRGVGERRWRFGNWSG